MKTHDELAADFCSQIRSLDIIEIKDIPNIDLYMDQVTTFMEKFLSSYKRSEDDKILTKTMINNYAKAKIFPAPVKKKYSRAHLMLLIMIYHLKSILSIKDIGILFHSALAETDTAVQAKKIENIYGGFIYLQKAMQDSLSASIQGETSQAFFETDFLSAFPDEETKQLMMVLLLVIRANVEKQLAERALDSFYSEKGSHSQHKNKT